MLRHAADTSLLAYQRLRQTPRLSAQECAVLRVLNLTLGDGLTRAEIALQARIRHSSACGRVRALLDAGVLQELPRRTCRVTGEQAHPVRTVSLQRELFHERSPP